MLRVVPVVHRRAPRCFVERFSVTRSEGAWEAPVGPPGQPWPRRSGFWGVPLFLALLQAVAVAVHLEDMNVVGETVEQGPGQALGAEHFRPLVEVRTPEQ